LRNLIRQDGNSKGRYIMANEFSRLGGLPWTVGATALYTKAGLLLGSAYAYASAGAAVGYRFCAPVSGNLTDVWFFVTAILGTPGVVTCELRNFNTTTATKPGTTLHAVQTITPGTTANKWINAHFDTPYSVVQGTHYWVVLGDAGWSFGKTTSVSSVGPIPTLTGLISFFRSYTTADGFTTAGSSTSSVPSAVLKFADGTLLGCPYTVETNDTSNALERGYYIAGLTEGRTLCGISTTTYSTHIIGLKVYQGTTAPGGTTVGSVTFVPVTMGNVGMAYFAPINLVKNTVYRVVLTFDASTTTPHYCQIEDYTTSTDITNCGWGGGAIYRTIDNNAGGWTDTNDGVPNWTMLFKDQIVQPGQLINSGVVIGA
jgi:hypothetical protein